MAKSLDINEIKGLAAYMKRTAVRLEEFCNNQQKEEGVSTSSKSRKGADPAVVASMMIKREKQLLKRKG